MVFTQLTKEQAKEKVRELIEKYEKVKESGRIKDYTEEETKKDFILPLFEALGWEVRNKEEVSAEEKASKGRVDYSFKINGITKFLLEAKPLKADLSNPKYSEQAVNYAWHRAVSYAVLTDFEGLRIFNAEWKWGNIFQNQLFPHIPYEKYLEEFDKLWYLSKESFEKAELDKWAEEWGKKEKKVKLSVEQQILTDLMKLREELSKNITLRNQDKIISEDELDETVQRLIDRLIFIRMCEDREIEEKLLISHLRDWEEHQKKDFIEILRDLFEFFQQEYDGKLFQPHLCDDIRIDDNILSEVIKGLYKTKDKNIQYDFSALDADVLGNIYEQYLSYILKKTVKRAKLTQKAQYRKQQGIYYTPTYIVDYIVKNTVGELLKDKNVNPEKIRILDPACGSGSFLIKAFDFLNEYHEEKAGEQKELDFSRKEKILVNNIFGVDLDPKAVEIAQLNLLLKTTDKRHRLPSLQKNIKCGNSLIDNKEVSKRAFKWEEEFKEIINEGGFDVVIGNPPYVSNIMLDAKEKEYYSKEFISAIEQYDILILFIEKGIKLLRENGYLGFIVSNKFMVSKYGLKIREYILKNSKIMSLVDVSNIGVFKDASTYPVIIILQKTEKNVDNKIKILSGIRNEEDFISRNYSESGIKQRQFSDNKNYSFEIHIDLSSRDIINKLEKNSVFLGQVLDVRKGIETGDDKKFIISSDKVVSLKKDDEKYLKKLIHSRDIGRYSVKWSNKYILYNEKLLKGPRKKDLFEQDKIVTCRTVKRLNFAYDSSKGYLTDTNQILLLLDKSFDLKYVLALINSSVINYFYSKKFEASHMQGGYFRCFKQYLDQIPLKKVSVDKQEPLINLVNKILPLNKRLNELGDKKTDEREKLEQEIKKTDKEIDELVYKIYGITEEEKKIIEESLG